jgi:hypothetical protein
MAREGGGLIWAWLGEEEPARAAATAVHRPIPGGTSLLGADDGHYSWLQDLEGTQDSSHLSWLHKAFHAEAATWTVIRWTYEIAETAYGLRTAALRTMDKADMVQQRVAEFVAPFYTLSPARQPTCPNDHAALRSFPIDDEAHLMFFGVWDEVWRMN